MAVSAPTAIITTSKTASGIACIVIGMVFFCIQDVMMKILMPDYSLWQLVTSRWVTALIILVPVIMWLGPPHRLFSPLVGIHFTRACLLAFGFSLFYAAFPFMGLAEVTTIFFAAPLFTALLAAVFLGERIGIQRLMCLLIGFAGVVIAMAPSGDTFQWIALLPLTCAICYAISQVLARRIGERETTITMGLYAIVLSTVFMMPLGYLIDDFIEPDGAFRHLRWQWELHKTSDLLVFAVLGAIGTLGYLTLTRAYQIANASLIAPFDYSYMPFAIVIAYLLFDEWPTQNTLIGMVLIAVSGIYLGYREIQQARRAEEPAPTGEVVFVPGHPGSALIHASDTLETYEQSGPENEAENVHRPL
ncbi:MAG: DMT family transporter [Pseudomonadota bacterium]